jgi:GT2 family glycosyltransferase
MGAAPLRGVSVVVPTFRRVGRLPAVVAPLLDDPATAELVVVVDGSRDGSLELLEDLAQRDRRVRPHFQANAGAAVARQTGVELAHGEVVLLLDDDVLPGPGLVTGHARAAEAHPGCVVVGRMPAALPSQRRGDTVTTELYAHEYEQCVADYVLRPERLLENLWTGNVSLPRALALEVGLGDSDLADLFPFEDREFGLRLRAMGTCAIYDPDLLAVHAHTRSLAAFRDDARRQGRALHVLAARHPDVVEQPTSLSLHGWLPGPLRLLLDAVLRRPALGRPLGWTAVAATRAAGAVRAWGLQRKLLLVVRHIAHAEGVGSAQQREPGR